MVGEMKYIRAKLGTHSSQRILHLKGRVALGSIIEWVEGPDYRAKWGRRHSGIIDRINPDGLIFVERM